MKIGNARTDFQHKLSRKLVNTYEVICLENLEVKEMQENDSKRSLHRSIADMSWSSFLDKVKYKAEEAGSELILVDPRYTSQTCSRCGTRHKLHLWDRKYACSACGLALDRDHNAALNILQKGLGLNTARNAEIYALGANSAKNSNYDYSEEDQPGNTPSRTLCP